MFPVSEYTRYAAIHRTVCRAYKRYQNCCSDSNQILRSDKKDLQVLFVDDPQIHPQIQDVGRQPSRWRSAAILKTVKRDTFFVTPSQPTKL